MSLSFRSRLVKREVVKESALDDLPGAPRAPIPVSSSRSCSCRAFPLWLVLHPPDRKETIEPDHLERSHRRLRPDEDEQLASSGMLAPARGKEQGERGRVDEGDRAEVDGEAANFLARSLRNNCPCQRVLNFRGAVEVELASEDKNRCSSSVPLEGKREVADRPGGPGLRPRRFARSR
jgi:hypothetical protein